jgi:deoxyribonuclease-4
VTATDLLLGAHVPVKGGVCNAPGNGRAIAATAIQIFTRNQMQWRARDLADDEARGFRDALPGSGVRHVMAHASYLINLAATNPQFLAMSRDTLAAEVRRCQALGIPHVVVHPGAHMGAGEAAGLRAIADSVDDVLERTRGCDVDVLLEITAGQGSCLGHRFEHLAEIMDRSRGRARLGICLDTCHLLAAGYDIARPKGYERTLEDFDRVVGLRHLRALHLNDSRRELGSRVDRHAHVGEGHLGVVTFARLLNDERLRAVPMVLETPGSIDKWRQEVALLRSLVRRPRRPAAPARPPSPTRRRRPRPPAP